MKAKGMTKGFTHFLFESHDSRFKIEQHAEGDGLMPDETRRKRKSKRSLVLPEPILDRFESVVQSVLTSSPKRRDE